MATIATKYPFVGSIDTKQGGRSENQDNAGFIDTPLGLLLVVCDGMGGGPGGRTASLMAVDTILDVLANVSEQTHRVNALKFAIEKANDIIYAKAKETPELRGMGTTVAAILINEESAVVAHAGDTRIYQLRKGTIVYRSSDHSVVANLVRQKQITEEVARNHPQSNIVTRALGIRPCVEIEFDEVTFIRGDRFVVCTDGIWGMMPQHDLIKSLSRIMGINELTSSLAEEIDRIGYNNGGNHDNLTLAVIDASFDSALRNLKKKHNVNNSIGTQKKGFNLSYKIGNYFLLLISFVIFIFIIFLYLNHDRNDEDKILEQNQKQLRGTTTTTIGLPHIKIKEGEPATQNSDDIKAPLPKMDVESPFKNSTIIDEKNKEIARQINHVVKNLENLKKIKGKNQVNAEEKKRRYVKNVITPEINRLRNEFVNEKKKNVKEILKMLNDKRTVSSNWRGQTSNDGRKHIEKIKIKVERLKN